VKISEIVVRDDDGARRAALGAITREAKRKGAKEFVLPLPWDDPLADFVRRHVGTVFSMHSKSGGGALLKVVDFGALLKALKPLFAERWKEKASAAPPTRFTLASEIGAVGFALSRGRVRVGEPVRGQRVWIPQRWFSSLLTGCCSVAEIAREKGSRVPHKLEPALDILFPSGWPFVYRGDNY
jgi:hypothetical protein